jgi:glycosyltransferase involved in cell wall biosynthesis
VSEVNEMTIISGSSRGRHPGLALLGLSAWLRRQGWLRGIYRHFPVSFRHKASQLLASRAAKNAKFLRTPRWAAEVQHAAPLSPSPDASTRFGAEAGVNAFGYMRGQFGLAESARLYTRALLDEGYPVAVHDIALDMAHSMGDSSLEAHFDTVAPHGINLLFVNPDYLDAAMSSIGRERLGGRYTIACWFWELEKFPDAWSHALEHVDEIMVSSRFVAEVVRKVTDKPVLHVPLPLLEIPDSGLQRVDFGLHEDAFIFLSSFDFNSFLARKNPLATIAAFRRAFPAGDEKVQLLVKTSNGHRHPQRLQELLRVAGADNRILVRDDVIDRSHVQALQRCVDAFVSLHRAEGFGLGLAECMRLGKPVIATAWSGNMEFMTADNSCLVDYELVPVKEGEYLHPAGQRWAEPDIEHAAAYMRRLVEYPGLAADIGRRAAADIRQRLAPQAVAWQIIRRLDSLRSTDSQGRAADPMT